MRRIEQDEAYALLDSLPEAQRTAVYLSDVMGLTTREISEIVEAPQNTVLSRIHRGRKRLREVAGRPRHGRELVFPPGRDSRDTGLVSLRASPKPKEGEEGEKDG